MPLDPKEVQDIIRIDSELNKIRDYDLLLERILFEARRMVGADAGSIYVKEADHLAIKYSQNDTKQRALPPGEKLIYNIFSIPINKGTISGYAACTGELVNIGDAYRIPKGSPFSYDRKYDKMSGYRTKSMLTVPLKTQEGTVIGVIQIINAKNGQGAIIPFIKEDEILVMHFASNAAVALQRAYMTRAMILRMIKMAELRDPKETGAHVNRVAGYSVELYDRWAFKHGVDAKTREKQKDVLKLAAMLHDVGKVAISDIILKKPAKFTIDEFMIMQAHTYLGAHLFDDPQSDLDRVSADVALTHHENWDGTGYPGYVDVGSGRALKTDSDGNAVKRRKDEIPFWGRIVSVADVYDALVSKRVYKDAWNDDIVIEEIKSLRGTKFDPELVDLFIEIQPRINQIRARYPESGAETKAAPGSPAGEPDPSCKDPPDA